MNVSAGFYTKYTETEKLSLDEIAQLIHRDYQDREIAELQILSPDGEIHLSSTGFTADTKIDSGDYHDAIRGVQGYWLVKML